MLVARPTHAVDVGPARTGRADAAGADRTSRAAHRSEKTFKVVSFAPERARRVVSKLRQTGRLLQAARDNIKEPPGIFVKVGIETMRGALKFIDDDLPRAFELLLGHLDVRHGVAPQGRVAVDVLDVLSSVELMVLAFVLDDHTPPPVD